LSAAWYITSPAESVTGCRGEAAMFTVPTEEQARTGRLADGHRVWRVGVVGVVRSRR
jgi:hypothetical protein